MENPELKFYCLQTKKGFATDNYEFFTKKNRYFAVTNHNDNKCVRIVTKEFYEKWANK